MKIVIVTHYFATHIGGIEIVAYNQAKSLVQQGNQVTLITSKVVDEPESQIIDGIRVVRVKASNIFENKFNIPYPIFSLKLVSVLLKELKRADICHIHDVFYMSSVLTAILAKITSTNFVLTQHVGLVHSNKFVNSIQKIVYEI